MKNKTVLQDMKGHIFDVKSVSSKGVIEGYGSVFGVEDAYGDIVISGAFDNSLAAHKSKDTLPAMLWQHHSMQPVGHWTDMREDDRGLFVQGQLNMEAESGREAYAHLAAGDIRGLSIGFRALKWEWDDDKNIRSLTEIDLWEVSIVTFPANRESNIVSVKGSDMADSIGNLKSVRDCERFLRTEANFSKDNATGMVAKIRDSLVNERDAQRMTDLQKSSDKLLGLFNS